MGKKTCMILTLGVFNYIEKPLEPMKLCCIGWYSVNFLGGLEICIISAETKHISQWLRKRKKGMTK